MDDAASTLNGRNPWSWYPVAASRDLVCGAIMPIVLNGESVVVWRSRSGAASAWSDRCPHRGMRLSYGAIHGESLICPYHGWTFGNDGYCVRIPAHPQTIPSRAAKTRIYPAVEADGYVWVCIGEPATDRPAPVPVLAHDRTQHVRTLHVPVETDVATAALLLSPLNAVDPKGDPIGFDTMRWTAVEGGLAISASGFTATVSAVGPMTCEWAGAEPLRYRLLFQPTGRGACAIQLGGDPAVALGLNRALVRFRHDLGRLLPAPDLERVRQTLARMLPAHVRG